MFTVPVNWAIIGTMSELPTAVVVIPTCNESATIAEVIDRILLVASDQAVGWTIQIVVVDGASEDGTADLVDQRFAEHPEVHLIREPRKRGIGVAYRTGFAYALEELSGEVVLEMDADLQHPPETLIRMLGEVEQGADLVLGSRRIPGGSYPRGWGLTRRVLSQFGGWLTRALLFAPGQRYRQITDPTTGLRATRCMGPSAIQWDQVRSTGFGYKLETLHQLARKPIRIAEIPLEFGLRTQGESKITRQTPREVLATAVRLRWQTVKANRFWRFAVVGGSGVAVNAVLLEMLARWVWLADLVREPAAWAAGLATEGAILWNFALNAVWTFRDRPAGSKLGTVRRAVAFNLSSLVAVALQSVGVGLATSLLGNTPLVRLPAMAAVTLVLVVPYNWLMYSRVIWRRQSPDASSRVKGRSAPGGGNQR